MLTGFQFLLVGLAAIAAGAINALAGGGTLITFPMLTAVGVPAVTANVTNTVALCPGYIGGTLAQRNDLKGQTKRLWYLLPAGVIGGLIGGILLLNTGEKLFRGLVPWLILAASLLLAIQDPVRAWLTRRMQANPSGTNHEQWSALPVGMAAIYGGYFGAGLSVIILAALGLTFEDSPHAPQCPQAIDRLQRQRGCSRLLFVLGKGRVARSARHGGRRVDRRRSRRTAGRSRQARHPALDGGLHRHHRFYYLLHPRLTNILDTKDTTYTKGTANTLLFI